VAGMDELDPLRRQAIAGTGPVPNRAR
jgi:hypothetical protein